MGKRDSEFKIPNLPKGSKTYFLYILRCKDNSLYTGVTNDLQKRLEYHRLGKGSKYVMAHLPFELVYYEVCKDKSDALKKEFEVKKLSKKEKEDLILNYPLQH